MKCNRLTLIGAAIAALIVVLSNMFELDPFDRLVELFESVEQYEIDEYFIAALVFLLFWLADLLLLKREQRVEAEKIKIYKAMIFSTQHILNNFLNQMLLFKMAAEETPGFDQNVLNMYNKIISDTTEQIEALSSITEISEQNIKKAVLPQTYPDKTA